jgi:hypothetical protein
LPQLAFLPVLHAHADYVCNVFVFDATGSSVDFLAIFCYCCCCCFCHVYPWGCHLKSKKGTAGAAAAACSVST